jgi:hypothetical protein
MVVTRVFVALSLPLLLIAGVIGPSRVADAQTAPRHVASTTWNGLVLRLRVSGGSLSGKALVRAKVTLVNRSTRTAYALSSNFLYDTATLGARVFRNDGTQAPIPPGANWPMTSAAPPEFVPLAAGNHVARQTYLILTGDIVRGGVQVRAQGITHLLTATVRLRLAAEVPPHLLFHSSPPIHGIVRPRHPMHGPLLYTYWSQCDGPPFAGSLSLPWSEWPSLDLRAPDHTGCSSWEWHGVAGWLNHPVVTVNYKSPS